MKSSLEVLTTEFRTSGGTKLEKIQACIIGEREFRTFCAVSCERTRHLEFLCLFAVYCIVTQKKCSNDDCIMLMII